MRPFIKSKWVDGFAEPVHTVGIKGTSIRLFMSTAELEHLVRLAFDILDNPEYQTSPTL